MKRILLFTMLLSVLLGTLTSCNTRGGEETKWLLTYEKKQYSDEFDNNSVIYEGYFEYDDSGKLVSEKFIYDSKSLICSNFEYDENGNLIHKSGTKTDNNNGELPYSYTYNYDSKNNCISTVVDLGTSIENITYEYDEYGNVIEAYSVYQSDLYTRKTDYTHKLSYDGGVCVEDEIQEKRTDEFETEVIYCSFKRYTYDENGNLAEERLYDCIENASDAKTPIKVNGRYYKHYSTTYYTYEKFEDVCVSTEENNQDSYGNSISTSKNESIDVKLSDSCDKVLASGYDANNNYYELVSNETEDYDGLKISIGVIKNNMWILEPTTNMPFVTKENTFSSNGPETGTIYYIGNGCFLSEKKYYSSKYDFTPDCMYIIYNATNGKTYSTSSYDWADKHQIPIPIKLDDGYMLIGYRRYESETDFTILNTNEMSTHQITINGYVKSFNSISEGLFAVAIGDNSYPDYYFYDIEGNEKINLSQYKTEDNQSVYFINQKCTIEIINDNNTKYNITIDKNGTVISSEKVN